MIVFAFLPYPSISILNTQLLSVKELAWRLNRHPNYVYPIISNPLRGALKLRVISTPSRMNNKFYELRSEAPNFSRLNPHSTNSWDNSPFFVKKPHRKYVSS